MFAQTILIEPFFPSVSALIARARRNVANPEQAAEQRFLNSGGVFFLHGNDGEAASVDPIPGSRTPTGASYLVAGEPVAIQRLPDTATMDGAAYLIDGVMVYAAGNFDARARGSRGSATIDLTSPLTGYIQRSEGKFAHFTCELVTDGSQGERKPLTPRDAAVLYCFLRSMGTSDAGLAIKPLYPVAHLTSPNTVPVPTGERAPPRPQ